MSLPTDPAALFTSYNVSAGITSPHAAPTSINTGELLAVQMRELLVLTRELVRLNAEHLEIARRAEERHHKRHQAQQQELERWFQEHDSLKGRCGGAEEVLRDVLGRAVTELVDYIDENRENLVESDFIRSDMSDRFGPIFNHVSAMHGMLKRLSLADTASADSQVDVNE